MGLLCFLGLHKWTRVKPEDEYMYWLVYDNGNKTQLPMESIHCERCGATRCKCLLPFNTFMQIDETAIMEVTFHDKTERNRITFRRDRIEATPIS